MSEHSRKLTLKQVTKGRPLVDAEQKVPQSGGGLLSALIFERVEAATAGDVFNSYGDIERVQVRNLRNHDGESHALVRD